MRFWTIRIKGRIDEFLLLNILNHLSPLLAIISGREKQEGLLNQ